MTITINPVDATLGAIVTDVKLASLDEKTWHEIHDAFLKYGVLVFPAQHLDDEEQGRFASWFGEAEKLAPRQTGPNIHISNQKADGSLAKPDEQHYQILRGNEGWHTDSTYMPLASKVAMLSALVVAPEDGETEFADMRAAWDSLDEQTQQKLAGLSACHSLYYSQAKAGFSHETDNMYGFHNKGAPLRPMVKLHPETGRKSIYTGRHAYGIVGMSEEESETLLRELLEDACQPPRVYKHTWQVGDTVVWDNRCLMHRARPYDANFPRVLRGTRISGDNATELAPTFADNRATGFQASESNESSLSV
ncbi:MAG: TauD/TfdA family dioxygenase [bacterium]|nr:TauD/TfdA family dioxygenase [Gammaproteobacteria bacterium]HIL94791.1 TauD/TfdA family dioxygenase [Pseudomonadales bacterium]